MSELQIEVELRPSLGKVFSPKLGRLIDVEHAQKEVWFRVPDAEEPRWWRWGLIANHKGAPLNQTLQELTPSEVRLFKPLITEKVAELRGEKVKEGGFYGFSQPVAEVFDEDELDADEAGIIEEA